MKITTFLITIAVSLMLYTSNVAAVGQSCNPNSTVNTCPTGEGCLHTSTGDSCQQVATICNFESVFENIIMVAGGLVGLAFFTMIIQGGFRYMMSGGDPKALQAARGTLTWGILGMAFFAISFLILLLISAFTGVDVTKIKICGY
jgi:hypothetical protein